MPSRSSLARVVQSIASIACLTSILTAAPASATATATEPSPGAAVLAGMWCNQDAQEGETIVGYSAQGLDVTALTVLSEADPRRIGKQASMQLTMEAPNVFSRRAPNGADEVFSIDARGLTIASYWVENRGTRQEVRQPVTSKSYQRCDVRAAWQRAQAFMSSPQAEMATRKALQMEAQKKSEREQWEQEQAEVEQRRNASRDAFYTDLIQQLHRAPGSISTRQRS